MNFGSPNLTKQKERRSLRTQQNVTQKRIIGTQQNITIFFISNCRRSQFDIIILFFYVHIIFTANLW